jgi:signal transduction histidine kinase
VLAFSHIGPDSGRVGKIYNVKGIMYYPIVSAATLKGKIVGYVVAWVKVLATSKSVAQLSQLLGGDASFYIGDSDNSLWTNLIKPLPKPPFKIGPLGKQFNYTDSSGNKIMADVQTIGHTDWLIVIAFPERTVLNGITSFVKWMSIIGIILTTIGMLAAWTMSRNITKPLKQLTAAATSISEGNYSSQVPVDVYKTNELGKLAQAFNIMQEQVYTMHDELENKVKERTLQLENVNKELEAFSYSVSHDLRTPLRAVNGYAMMLKEDYADKLDNDAQRIIRNIISNAKMMGQLIDDLLAFSRLGKKELKRARVDMRSLAKTVVDELLQQEPEGKYNIHIGSLPGAMADEVMIKQALVNLVGNAIKYSSKKASPEIEIGFQEDETTIIYCVKDNGAGFDIAYSNKLFGVFQRLHSQDEFEGSGVGLALVKRIIEKHKGKVWAEAVENEGATFYFSLPKP